MTLTGVMAISDDKYIKNDGAPRGSGKTATVVYYAIANAIKKNHKIYANIHLNLPKDKFEYHTANDIVKLIVENELSNITVIIDEIHLILNSMGEEKDKVAFYLKLFYQARKLNVDIFFTVIRFMDLHPRFRQQTENQLMPQKYHYHIESNDNGIDEIVIDELCPVDSCKKNHVIKVFSIKPFYFEPITILNPQAIGKYYDTNEFVRDS